MAGLDDQPVTSDWTRSMLRINHNEYMRGFQLTFENGYTLSVQFGPGNYCENRDMLLGSEHTEPLSDESNTAEIAVFSEQCDHPHGLSVLSPPRHWYRPTSVTFDDDVRGWTTADEVALVIAEVSALERCQL